MIVVLLSLIWLWLFIVSIWSRLWRTPATTQSTSLLILTSRSHQYQVSSTKYQVSSIKYQVPSIKYQVSSTKYQVSSIKVSPVSDCCAHITYHHFHPSTIFINFFFLSISSSSLCYFTAEGCTDWSSLPDRLHVRGEAKVTVKFKYKYKMLKTPHHMQYFWKAVQGYQIWHWQWQPELSK